MLVAILALLTAAGVAVLTVAWIIRRPPFGTNIRRAGAARRWIALTFDDGPNPPHTRALLEVLARHGVKATFFMVGESIERHPEAARAVVKAGHEAGNHSFTHRRLVGRSVRFVRSEIARTDAALRKIGVRGPIPFRAPYGTQFLSVARVLGADRRENILYDVSPRDWATQDADLIARRALRRVRPGSIVLLHDGGGDRGGTVAAVDALIPRLRAHGYHFATVSEFLAAGSA